MFHAVGHYGFNNSRVTCYFLLGLNLDAVGKETSTVRWIKVPKEKGKGALFTGTEI